MKILIVSITYFEITPLISQVNVVVLGNSQEILMNNALL